MQAGSLRVSNYLLETPDGMNVVNPYRFSDPASAYAAAVLADSPTAYWRLGEASGTTAADEVGTYDGT